MAEVKYDDVYADEGYAPSRLKSVSNGEQSYSKPLLDRPAPGGVFHSAIWKAGPGEYVHPGGEHGETFVVISGEGALLVEGQPPLELAAGSIVEIPPNTPATMRVTRTVRKVAIVAPHG